MGLFSDAAKQHFRLGEAGEKLFYLGGRLPWSKPLILTERTQIRRAYTKLLWMNRICFAFGVIGTPLLFRFIPDITGKSSGFITYMASVLLICWIAQRIVFRRELRDCSRLPPLSLRVYFRQMANWQPIDELVCRLILFSAVIILGLWILLGSSGAPLGIGIFCIVVGGLCGGGSGYALKLKLSKVANDGAVPSIGDK